MEIEFAYPSMIYRSEKGLNPQFTQEFFSEIVAIATKNLQRIQSKTNKRKLYESGNFYEKELNRVI